MQQIKQQFFGDLDFVELQNNPDFKNDSVIKIIILLLLNELGYNQNNIVHSKSLQSLYIKIGSKKRNITLISDYLLKLDKKYTWVLDTKVPNPKIVNSDNVGQVFSYSILPEICNNYFALCNVLEFSLFRQDCQKTNVIQEYIKNYTQKEDIVLDTFRGNWVTTIEAINISETILQSSGGIIAQNNMTTLEEINNELIIRRLELSFLDLLKKECSDLTPILFGNFDYIWQTEIFTIHKDTKFHTHIDVRLCIKYYITSYLHCMKIEVKTAHFDDIVLNILPLLRNRTTLEHQTIISVLEDISKIIGEDSCC